MLELARRGEGVLLLDRTTGGSGLVQLPDSGAAATATRRRHLNALGIHPDELMKASRCRRGYWCMSGNGIGSGAPAPAGLRPRVARIPLAAPSGSSVQRALNNVWLREQGVPDLKQPWIELGYEARNRKSDPSSVNLTRTA